MWKFQFSGHDFLVTYFVSIQLRVLKSFGNLLGAPPIVQSFPLAPAGRGRGMSAILAATISYLKWGNYINQ